MNVSSLPLELPQQIHLFGKSIRRPLFQFLHQCRTFVPQLIVANRKGTKLSMTVQKRPRPLFVDDTVIR